MNILTLETTTIACSAALLTASGVSERYAEQPQQHAKLVLPMVHELLEEAGIALNELAAIGYGRGPGAFTGVRIGVSVAQGLGVGAALGLVGVSSLAILAAEVLHDNPQASVCIAQDARMSELYTARFNMINGMATLIGSERLCAPQALAVEATDLLAGDAWERVPSLAAVAAGRSSRARYPRAKFALGLTKMAINLGQTLPAAQASANYLRDSVVKPV